MVPWKKKNPPVTVIGDGTRRVDLEQLMADEKVQKTLEELAVRFKDIPGPLPPDPPPSSGTEKLK